MLDHVITTSNLTVDEFILTLMGSSSKIQESWAPKVTVYREQGRTVRHAASEQHKFEQERVPNQDDLWTSNFVREVISWPGLVRMWISEDEAFTTAFMTLILYSIFYDDPD